ncbi:MAG: cation diffusion facilitator family transporter [Bacilli bacterium]
MKNLLLRLFIKDYKNIENPKVRLAYGILSGIVGIVSNLILFIIKILIGIISLSIAIIADAINNLSDAATSIITLIGFKLASKPADDEHPFGHDRIEYVAGLIISVVILVVGILLFKTSIEKIINPKDLIFNKYVIIILGVSILIKMWQSWFYYRNSKIINSKTLKANAIDSINDFIITTVILISFLINQFLGVNIDGYIGVIIAVVILISGIKLVKETASSLVGEVPSQETVKQIKDKILKVDEVLGMHDLIIHSYGPLKKYASVHVEVNNQMTIEKSHMIIDEIEESIKNDLNIDIVIHIDPVDIDCEKRNKYFNLTQDVIKAIDETLEIHDFRIIKQKNKDLIVFDLVVPFNYEKSTEKIKETIINEINKLEKNVKVKIVVETEIIKIIN